MPRGTPTNGYLPFGLGNYSVSLGEGWDGVISFCLYGAKKKLPSLASNNVENKCDDCYDQRSKSEKLFISNHLTTPFREGEVPSAVSGVPLGLAAKSIVAYFEEKARKVAYVILGDDSSNRYWNNPF